MKKYLVLFGLTGLFLAGCSTTPSPKTLAQEGRPPQMITNTSAGTVAPIAVPSDLSANHLQTTYDVPEVAQTNGEEQPSVVPPGSNVEQITKAAAVTPAAPKSSNSNVGLSANMDYNATWKKLGKALPAAGYPVVEQDSGSGTYYVLDKVSSGGVIKRDTPIYQVRLENKNNTTLVTVLNAQNQLADQAVSARILGAVKSKL